MIQPYWSVAVNWRTGYHTSHRNKTILVMNFNCAPIFFAQSFTVFSWSQFSVTEKDQKCVCEHEFTSRFPWQSQTDTRETSMWFAFDVHKQMRTVRKMTPRMGSTNIFAFSLINVSKRYFFSDHLTELHGTNEVRNAMCYMYTRTKRIEEDSVCSSFSVLSLVVSSRTW